MEPHRMHDAAAELGCVGSARAAGLVLRFDDGSRAVNPGRSRPAIRAGAEGKDNGLLCHVGLLLRLKDEARSVRRHGARRQSQSLHGRLVARQPIQSAEPPMWPMDHAP
jgi:hypothetical protein